MPRPPNITLTPFKSSKLSIPPSPFSPRSPLEHPSSSPPRPTRSPPKLAVNAPSPPRTPLHWLWQCHICKRQYRLGVTRRCLDDGHYFCAGTSTVRRSNGGRRIKRHRACSSEFDYQGWKTWGTWRRAVVSAPTSAVSSDEEAALFVQSAVSPLFGRDAEQDFLSSTPPESAWFRGVGRPSPLKIQRPERPIKNCWDKCDYPSECRWGKQFGVQTPASAPAVSFFEPDLDDMPVLERMGSANRQDTGFGDLFTEQSGGEEGRTTDIGLSDLTELVEDAIRRKSRDMGHSPLAADPESLTKGFEELKIEEVGDGKEKRGSATSAMIAFNGMVEAVMGAIGGVVAGSPVNESPDLFARSLRQGSKKRKGDVVENEGGMI